MIMAWLAGLPLALWRGLGAVLGLGLWLFAWQRRRVVWVNLTLCFTHASRARRSWWSLMVMVHFAQTWLDRVWLWHASPALLAKRLKVHGELGESGAQVYLAPHFMGLDAGWTALTRSQPECRMATIYAPQSMAWLNRWMTRGRGRFGQPTMFTKRGQLREVVRWLRQGGALYLLPDLDVGARDAVFVDFMGVPTATATVLPRLVALSGATVRPVLTLLTRQGYAVHVLPTMSLSSDANVEHATQHMNHAIGQWVAQHPTQYWWVHRRFKTQPPGQSSPYR